MNPKEVGERLVNQAVVIQGYTADPDCDRRKALVMVNALVNICSEMASWILYEDLVGDMTNCHHCGAPIAKTFGVLIHLDPVIPDCPDICFVDDPNFSACDNPSCTPLLGRNGNYA